MKYFCISNISSSGALGVSNSQIRTCSIFNMRAISYLAMLAFQLYQLLLFSIIHLLPHHSPEGKEKCINHSVILTSIQACQTTSNGLDSTEQFV